MRNAEQILVIDDDSTGRLFVSKVLEGAGYCVRESADLASGLASAQQQIPHLIVLDLLMPNGSGFDFLERKKALGKIAAIPVLVLSGLSDRGSIYKAMALGALEYVTKPVDARILVQKVRKLVLNREFASVSFEAAARPKVKMRSPGKIVTANEMGFLLEVQVKIAPDTQLSIESPLLERLGCADCVFQKTRTPAKAGFPGQYLNEVAAVGLNEGAVKKIREVTRVWK